MNELPSTPLTRLAKKRIKQVRVDYTSNPFCADRQILDQKILMRQNRNPRRLLKDTKNLNLRRAYMRNSSVHAASPREDSHLYTNLNAKASDFSQALARHKSEVPVRYSSRDPMDEFAKIPHSYRSTISRRGMESLGSFTGGNGGFRSAKIDSVINETLHDVGFSSSGRGGSQTGSRKFASRGLSRSASASASGSTSSAMARARRHAPEGEAPVSFGHRPGSASRVLNPLSLSISKVPKRKRTLPAAGVLSAKDLFQLLHSGGPPAIQPTSVSSPSVIETTAMPRADHASFVMSPGYSTISGATMTTERIPRDKEIVEGRGWLGGHFLVGGAESMFVEDAPAGSGRSPVRRRPRRRQTPENKEREKPAWQNVSLSVPSMHTGTGLSDVRVRAEVTRFKAATEGTSTKEKMEKYRKLAGGTMSFPAGGARIEQDRADAADFERQILNPPLSLTLGSKKYLKNSRVKSISPRGLRHDIDDIMREVAERDRIAAEEERARREEAEDDERGGTAGEDGYGSSVGVVTASREALSRGGSSRISSSRARWQQEQRRRREGGSPSSGRGDHLLDSQEQFHAMEVAPRPRTRDLEAHYQISGGSRGM